MKKAKKKLIIPLVSVFTLAVVFLTSTVPSYAAAKTTITLGNYYYIASSLDTSKVLDVENGSKKDEANIQLYRRNGSDAQLFKIIKKNGYYIFINKGSGKAIDVSGGLNSNGTNVHQYHINNTNAQNWMIYNSGGNGYVRIKSANGKYLDVSGANTQNGTNIQIWERNGTNAQRFKLIPYINTTYKTISLNFNSYQSWQKAMVAAERSAIGFPRNRINANGTEWFSGNMITGMTVLSYKTVNVKVSYNTPGYYKTVKVRLPSKIKFKLHKHSDNLSVYFNFSALTFTQYCECGESNYWEWEVPWPEQSDNSGKIITVKKIYRRL